MTFPERIYRDPFEGEELFNSGYQLKNEWQEALEEAARTIRDRQAEDEATRARQAQTRADGIAFLNNTFNNQGDN